MAEAVIDLKLIGTLSERLRLTADFLQTQAPPRGDEALAVAAFIFDLREASELLSWNFMNDDRLALIKAEGTRVLVSIPWKKVPQGKQKTTLPPRVMFAHWSTAVMPTKAVTPSKHSLDLDDKHGGFWASDKRGIKPIKGAPTLWMFAPISPEVK